MRINGTCNVCGAPATAISRIRPTSRGWIRSWLEATTLRSCDLHNNYMQWARDVLDANGWTHIQFKHRSRSSRG